MFELMYFVFEVYWVELVKSRNKQTKKKGKTEI